MSTAIHAQSLSFNSPDGIQWEEAKARGDKVTFNSPDGIHRSPQPRAVPACRLSIPLMGFASRPGQGPRLRAPLSIPLMGFITLPRRGCSPGEGLSIPLMGFCWT